MNLEQLTSFLGDSSAAASWLRDCGIRDLASGHAAFVSMEEHGMTLDLLSEISEQLEHALPTVSDPDLALTTFARFVGASRNPLSLGSLFESEDQSLPILLQLFSSSKTLGDSLVEDPAAFDLIRLTDGNPVEAEQLRSELCNEVASLKNNDDVMASLRVFRRRETLRIAYGDIIRQHDSATVTQQLSNLADAVCEAALQFAYRQAVAKRGIPTYGNGEESKLVVLGLGRFGGRELDYHRELDVLFLYDFPGRTNGDRSIDNHEFFAKVATHTIQLLGEETETGFAYKLITERATAFANDQKCGDIVAAQRHFDTRGRTWERLALIKARPIAGEPSVAFRFLDAIEPWVYRRYLSRSDISGIKALQRRLVKRNDRHGLQLHDVEGGILDVEFVVRFLQLINGGDDRQIRVGNTFQAIGLLEQNGAITSEEGNTLEKNYAWLRRVEHRLEVMHDTETHMLPNRADDLKRLAIRCGYEPSNASEEFQGDYKDRIDENQEVITRLLNDAFDEGILDVDAETDLVMDPNPRPETIHNILSPYGFRDTTDAYHNIEALGRERIAFLSTRRCRHFLALIAKPLLWAISKTPYPDATLANLVRVSDSLGGKGVLWELFNINRASLDLYVRLCSSSPYLTAILTRFPGMIDELTDSLMLAELPTLAELQTTLDELCGGSNTERSVDELDAILHSFKNTQHLNVGVRELLDRVDIRDSTATLSDVAETCLHRIAYDQHRRLVRKLGEPRMGEKPCGFILLGMGKLGGREPNYHSDVDFISLFEGEGETYHPPAGRHRDTTTNQHFFGELGRKIVKAVSENGAHGKLYDSDQRLRPIDAGPIAVSLEKFRSHYLDGPRRFLEIRGLCQARPVYGSEPLRARATAVLKEILTQAEVTELDSQSIKQARREIQQSAGPRNLKRGPGGTVDVEFITQFLQLRHAKENPEVLSTNTLSALEALAKHDAIPLDICEKLSESYRFLRKVEAMLRMLNTTARHDLPREADELAKLAYLMRFDRAGRLESACARVTKTNRDIFDQLV